jgi:hypothetical protein
MRRVPAFRPQVSGFQQSADHVSPEATVQPAEVSGDGPPRTRSLDGQSDRERHRYVKLLRERV